VLKEIAIVRPVFNDWDGAQRLLPLAGKALCATSTAEPANAWPGGFAHIGNVSIPRPSRNLGHQRAVASGLVHVYQHLLKIEAL
jgi:hypothetical protein